MVTPSSMFSSNILPAQTGQDMSRDLVVHTNCPPFLSLFFIRCLKLAIFGLRILPIATDFLRVDPKLDPNFFFGFGLFSSFSLYNKYYYYTFI